MARTDSDMVEEILGENWGGSSLDLYIRTATAVVDRVVTCAETKEHVFTSEELIMMETWLAAYFYTIMDPMYKRKKTERAEGEFLTTSYLDAAKMLDSSGGCLSAVLSGKTASMFWGGLPASEQTDFDDRD